MRLKDIIWRRKKKILQQEVEKNKKQICLQTQSEHVSSCVSVITWFAIEDFLFAVKYQPLQAILRNKTPKCYKTMSSFIFK